MMDYNSYFMDNAFEPIEYKTDTEKTDIMKKIVAKFGDGHYKVVSWESRFDMDNGFDLVEAENSSLSDAVEMADNLIDFCEAVSANILTKDDVCVYCVNSWLEDEENAL